MVVEGTKIGWSEKDWSSGYEAVARDFLPYRAGSRSVGVGVAEVRDWAKRLPRGCSVLDVGCGAGYPLTSVLVDGGHEVFGVDASPTLVAAFRRNLPGTPVLCESVQESQFFSRSFDAVLAWGLLFLLKAEEQHRLIQRFAAVLVPHGQLLFTAPAQAGSWADAMTQLESVSLGAPAYRELLESDGFSVQREYEGEGQNHHFEAVKG